MDDATITFMILLSMIILVLILFVKNSFITFIPIFSAASAVLLVGSIPIAFMSVPIKFLSRYPSFEAISITRLSESKPNLDTIFSQYFFACSKKDDDVLEKYA